MTDHDTQQAQQRTNRNAERERSNGISEALIERLVRRFYERIQEDAALGPIFAAKVSDWEPHLQRMFAFWSSVTLASGRYHGRPMPKHVGLPVDSRHFDRWLALFEATAREVCSPAAAEHFSERARTIAMSLEQGRALTQGRLLGRGERYLDESLHFPAVRVSQT